MLTLLAVSSALALNAVPVQTESPGDVMKDIGREMNGDSVHRDHYWREHERDQVYRHEQHHLNDEWRELDARRGAMHDERRLNEETGFYGR